VIFPQAVDLDGTLIDAPLARLPDGDILIAGWSGLILLSPTHAPAPLPATSSEPYSGAGVREGAIELVTRHSHRIVTVDPSGQTPKTRERAQPDTSSGQRMTLQRAVLRESGWDLV
jgi:hypothetical protein